MVFSTFDVIQFIIYNYNVFHSYNYAGITTAVVEIACGQFTSFFLSVEGIVSIL